MFLVILCRRCAYLFNNIRLSPKCTFFTVMSFGPCVICLGVSVGRLMFSYKRLMLILFLFLEHVFKFVAICCRFSSKNILNNALYFGPCMNHYDHFFYWSPTLVSYFSVYGLLSIVVQVFSIFLLI